MSNFYNIKKQSLILLFSLLISGVFYGQTGWTVDPAFNKRIVKTRDFFFRIAKRTDGSFLFNQDTDKSKIGLLNADGTINPTFSIATNGNILAISQAQNNKMYIGGDFTSSANVFAPKIIRINNDGTRDVSFLPDTNAQNVYALQEQADGKLLVGRNGSIQRLNSDGTVDTTFATITTNGIVYSFSILPSGKILAGGVFTTINGVAKNRIVLLNTDGTVDTSFVVGAGFNNEVYVVRVAFDGSFYVGGKFTTFKGTTINRIAKISNTGTLDATFHTSNTGFDNDVWTIEFLNDNKPLIGGLFTTYKGVPNNSLIKLNSDGSIDNTFDTGTANSNGAVYKMIINSPNDVFVSGNFLKYKNTYTNQSFMVNNDGTINNTYHFDERFCMPGFSFGRDGFTEYHATPSYIKDYSYTEQSDGKILLSEVYYENKFYNLIRLNADGTRDDTFNFTSSSLPTGYVAWEIKDILIRPNGKIICSGQIGKTSIFEGCLPLKGLFQLNADGTLDTTFDTGFIYELTDSNACDYGQVITIALQNDGKVLLHSNRTFNYKGFQANEGLIRILENGNIDISFQNITGNFDSYNVEILPLPNNKILVYHNFKTNNGYGANPNSRKYGIVLLNEDGTLNNRFENFNLGYSNTSWMYSPFITKIKLIDNNLMICGSFDSLNGVDTRGAVYVDLNGNPITYFSSLLNNPNSFNGAVYEVEKLNNKYYFTTVNDVGTLSGDLSVNGRDPNHDYVNFDYNIISSNLNGSINTAFSPITISAYKRFFVDAHYINYPQYSYYYTSPNNLFLKAKSTNMLTVFGTYTSLNNETRFGLSRIIIDENLSMPNNQFLRSKIKFYPNPTKDKINITAQNESITQINIYDMFGRLLKFQQGNTNNEQVSIQELPNAIYLIEVKTANSSETIKIVKE